MPWPKLPWTGYKLQGRLVVPAEDVLDWARWFERSTLDGSRIVAVTEVGPLRVSTITDGLDHGASIASLEGRNPEPLVFETVVFGADAEGVLDYRDRYVTWAEAEEGHARAVAWAEARVAAADAAVRSWQGEEPRACTCPAAERPAVCQRRYALSECLAAAVRIRHQC